MNMITYFNDLVTKNFNNYLKKYFNSINYIDKKVILNILMNVSLIHIIERNIVILMAFMKGKTLLLYSVKYLLKEDTIMILIPMNIFSLLICF